jgi:Rad3-related DNA helicase
MTGLPSPSVLLGVPGFPEWYPGQQDAFAKTIGWFHSPARFLGLSLPTGSGKSCISILIAKMSGARTCILTATKGLQDQLMRDFGSIASVVKGQNNFRCTLVPTLNADEGPCHEGMPCAYSRSGGCPYREQLKKALDAQIVITNYAYYLAQTRYSSGLGEFGLVVLDEAHQSFSALENHLTVYLDRMSIESLGLQFPSLPTSDIFTARPRRAVKKTPVVDEKALETENVTDTITAPDLWAQWQSWAFCGVPVAQEQATELEAEVRELRESNSPVPGALSRSYRTAKSTLAKLQSLSSGTGDWVIQRTHHGMVFTPRWVADKGSALFQSVPKIMLMSAILSHKTADSIGVPTGDDRAWLEVGSYFPPQNTPIWHVPTARINYRSDDYATTIWQSRIDQIIQRRLDRKGIIFTVSYDRARLLLSRSRFKDIMLTHSTGDVTLVVDRFKKAAPPMVLVSPTVTTGWDFPMLTSGQGKPQYGVIGKIPYPDTKDLVLQARHEDDKDWTAYLAMETFVQSCGRLNRTKSDLSEILIVDDNFIWWWPAYRKFSPKWFQERVRGSLTCVPEPLV